MKIPREKANSGQTLIEPLLAIAIFSLLLAPFIGAISNLAHSQVKYRHQTEAVQYAREGLEINYNSAVNDWESFSDTGNLGETTSPPEGRFTRKITISQARRDDDGNLAENGGTWDDPKTLKVTSEVTWDEQNQPQEIELTTYLIDLNP